MNPREQSKLVVARGCESEEQGVTSSGYRIPFWSDENVQELVMSIAQPCEYIKNTELYTIKVWILWYINYIVFKWGKKTKQIKIKPIHPKS